MNVVCQPAAQFTKFSMTPSDVMAAPPGPERDKAIDAWCVSVWTPWQSNRRTIANLLDSHGILPIQSV